jgi:hypothetical protein
MKTNKTYKAKGEKMNSFIVSEQTWRPFPLQYYWTIRTGEGSDCDLIAIVPSKYPQEDAASERNARLLASAPELRDALVGLLTWVQSRCLVPPENDALGVSAIELAQDVLGKTETTLSEVKH